MNARLSFVMMLSVITLTSGALDTWRPQQTIHERMVTLEEKLQNLDNTKCDSALREIAQKLDDIQTTVRRQDSTFQDKLDKLERNLNSKDLKDELMVEKLSHKMRDILDTSYDRYSRRLGYTEERLEMSLKKVQMSIEGILTRLEKHQEDIQADVTETITIMEDLKASTATEERLNSTQRAIKQHIQNVVSPNRDELQRITGSLDHIGSRLNNSLGMWGSQNDVPQSIDILSAIRTEINLESNKLTTKINNMYNEMWRRMISMESLLKDLGRLGNMTRQDLLEEVRSLVPSDHRDFPGESQEISGFLEVAFDALERKLQKLGRNVDTLSDRQNKALVSCSVCQELEPKLSQVLERIYDVLSGKIETSSNSTANLSNLVMELMELEKMHHKILFRTVTHNTNMVVTSAKDNSDANKLLHHNITRLADHFQELHDDIENLNGKVCTDSETRTEKEPSQAFSQQVTEVKFFSLNNTEVIPEVPKKHDVGVLKITTDNLANMADNVSKLSENVSSIADSSIMHIISTLPSNLTSQQLESLFHVLNSSMSFDNLEAIIQNTEGDTPDTGSIDMYDTDLLIRTNGEDDLNEDNPEAAFSGENNFEETDDVLNQDGTTEYNTNSTTTFNITDITEKEINRTITNTTEPNLLKSVEVQDHIKVYEFLWKLKHGVINVTRTIEQIKTQNENDSELILVLQNLCYGQEDQSSVSYDYTFNVMKNRLLLIKQTLNNLDIYERVENICNSLIESAHRQTTTKDEIL